MEETGDCGKESFVRNLAVIIISSFTPDDLAAFDKVKNDTEEGRFFFEHETGKKAVETIRATVKAKLEERNCFVRKDAEKALDLKTKGNKLFGAGKDKEALEFYSQAASFMPPNTDNNELSVIYGNRSAGLFHMGEYDLALKDIDLALQLGYPDSLKPKLTARAKAAKQKVLEGQPKDKEGPKRGNEVEGVSNKLECVRTPDLGRFMVAKEEMKPGELILMEKPFVSVTLPHTYHKFCIICFNPLRRPIFCPGCSTVSFCSAQCKDLALRTHHKFECKILDLLSTAAISVTCMLTLRLLSKGREGDGKLLRTWFEIIRRREEEKEEGALSGHTTEFPFTLVTHPTKGLNDKLQRALMAVFLLAALEEGNFFPNGGQDEKVQVLTILLRTLKFMQFNAHEVAAWDEEIRNSIGIGGALYVNLSLFNHSCNPTIMRYFVNGSVVVRTVRNIRPGEPVTENYGPIYTCVRREERREVQNSFLRMLTFPAFEMLKHYRFTCNCKACEENWPLFEDFGESPLAFRCSRCRARLCTSEAESLGLVTRCPKCSKPNNVFKMLKTLEGTESKYKKAMDLIEMGKRESAVGILSELLILFDSLLEPPFRDFSLCQEGLRKCYLNLGNQSK